MKSQIEASFLYPETGYIFETGERAEVVLQVHNLGERQCACDITGRVTDYRGNMVQHIHNKTLFAPRGVCQLHVLLDLKRLGYYKVELQIETEDRTLCKSTGVGLTTPFSRERGRDSVFGIDRNRWEPERDFGIFHRMGVKYLRATDEECRLYRDWFEKYDMKAFVQHMGTGEGGERYVPYTENSAYTVTREGAGVITMQEHGNECWGEHNLNLLSEWQKISNLAKWEADPHGWYSPTGLAGCDVERLRFFYEQGCWEYISFIGLHAYTFPRCPESIESYWSLTSLKRVAAFMDEVGHLPVVCSEQGYPAMYDQEHSEAYSPEDMVTLEAQADYLVRKFVLMLSYGVAKILWFNGPYYEGFGILEKEGPAPWPAAMAMAEMIRTLDDAVYIGDLELGRYVYCKVFRRESGRLLAVAWRPIYVSRSVDPRCNFTVDYRTTQAAGGVRESHNIAIPYTGEACIVRDIMGNRFDAYTYNAKGNLVLKLGESPLYIEGLDEAVCRGGTLHDRRIFRQSVMGYTNPAERPFPRRVILGIQDSEPVREAYHTAAIVPGEQRTLLVRVHNFRAEALHTVLKLSTSYELSCPEAVPVQVAPFSTETVTVPLCCRQATPTGVARVTAALAGDEAAPVFQLYRVHCPVSVVPLTAPPQPGETLAVRLHNAAPEPATYRVQVQEGAIHFDGGEWTVTVPAGEAVALPLPITSVDAPLYPLVRVALTCETAQSVYDVVIPIRFIRSVDDVRNVDLAAETPIITTGYDRAMTALKERTGSELVGEGRADVSVISTVQAAADAQHLRFRIRVGDPHLVCVKNTRRNNADSDGVWLDLFATDTAEEPAYRFCIMPADASGDTAHPSVREFASGIVWNTPYSVFDLSRMRVEATFQEEAADPVGAGYTLDIEIDRAALPLLDGAELARLVMALRVTDMNEDDWPHYFDSGKLVLPLV